MYMFVVIRERLDRNYSAVVFRKYVTWVNEWTRIDSV